MYLDMWMIVVLVVAFGICHLISKRQGLHHGAVMTLKLLENEKIIRVSDDGNVSRYSTWNDKPIMRRRSKNADI